MKDKKEWFVINKFKDIYTKFPKGVLQKFEQPDFIIIDEKRTIGIELAEVFQDSHLGKHSQLKQQESVQDKFEKSLIEAIQQYTDKNFKIGVTFSGNRKIVINRIKELVKDCLPSCLEFIWNNEPYCSIHLSNHYHFLNNPLPDEVDEIFIMVSPKSILTFNDQSQGGTVSNLEYKHIEPTLLRHTEVMNKYSPCDEYWFVISEGNYYAGTFDKVNISTPIHSAFDKVFLLRTKTDEVIELK